jgi:hypothetical protein
MDDKVGSFLASHDFLPPTVSKKVGAPTKSPSYIQYGYNFAPWKNVTVPRMTKDPQRGILQGLLPAILPFNWTKKEYFCWWDSLFACFAANWGQFFGWYFLNCCCPGVITKSPLLKELTLGPVNPVLGCFQVDSAHWNDQHPPHPSFKPYWWMRWKRHDTPHYHTPATNTSLLHPAT